MSEIGEISGEVTSNAKGFLTKRLGPLPVWGWTAIGAGTLGVVLWFRRRGASTSADTAAGFLGYPSTSGDPGDGMVGSLPGSPSPNPNQGSDARPVGSGGSGGGGAGSGSGGGSSKPQVSTRPQIEVWQTPDGRIHYRHKPATIWDAVNQVWRSTQRIPIDYLTMDPQAAHDSYAARVERNFISATLSALQLNPSKSVKATHFDVTTDTQGKPALGETEIQDRAVKTLTGLGYTAARVGKDVIVAKDPKAFFDGLGAADKEAQANLARLLVSLAGQGKVA